ncbi:MAG: helix-turn-helix transcriptional regulator [Solirubrobacteraceae bacterium]
MAARRSADARRRAADTASDPLQDQLALGRVLRGLRERAGITQDQLATRLAIDPTYVSQVERGRRGVRWHTVLRLLRALETTLGDLATEIDGTAGPSRSRRG